VVVDLCCGSGAVGAALLAAEPSIELHAADLDPVAVRCARRNVPRVHQGDLFEALPGDLRGRVDLVTVNAPYVPTGELELMPREARLHEPRSALDGGHDGLEVLRRAAAEAPSWLAPGGRVVVEAAESQEAALREHAGETPLTVTTAA
jgi:release factor glutamine methyltransferase